MRRGRQSGTHEGMPTPKAKKPTAKKSVTAQSQANAPAREPRAKTPAVVDWSAAYVAELAHNGGQIVKACEVAGITLSVMCRRRKSDPVFAAEEREAQEVARDAAESEARRRAIEGVEKRWFDKEGKLIRIEREYSDTILLRLLEKLETGSWRQKQQIEHGTPGAFATRAERLAALEAARAEIAATGGKAIAGQGQNGAPPAGSTEKGGRN